MAHSNLPYLVSIYMYIADGGTHPLTGAHPPTVQVLLEESPGVAFRRLRSASSITSVCLLYTLRYSDVQHLQALSPAIDTAVQRASDTVRANRAKSLKQVGSDSLFRGGEVGSNGAGREDVGVEERLTRLESKMDQLICLCQHRQGTMK